MSTSPPPATTKANENPQTHVLRIVSHCSLFYWWPVWAVGFIMFAISMLDGYHMTVVPTGTSAWKDKVEVEPTDDDKKAAEKNKKLDVKKKRDALVYPLGAEIPPDPSDKNRAENPRLHMSNNKNLGVLFCTVLLLVIVITNVPLRGLWSFIVIMIIIGLSIILGLMEWWGPILAYFSYLDIRINAAGYLVISLVLFVLWVVVFCFFDRQLYYDFSPGQMRVRLEIGEAETTYNTAGMTVKKERSDLFRHWVLGLGSGDLIIKTGGANSQEFHIPNVLFIGGKIAEIEKLVRQQQVVTGKEG